MSDDNVNYEMVLADLRSKRDRLDTAIQAIEELIGIAGEGASGDIGPQTQKITETTVSEDTFLGMSAPQAAEKFLRIAKRPKTTGEIAEALQKGGIHTTSENFVNTVYTALVRNKGVIRLGRGKWSLREWHPGARTPESKKKSNGSAEGHEDDVASESASS